MKISVLKQKHHVEYTSESRVSGESGGVAEAERTYDTKRVHDQQFSHIRINEKTNLAELAKVRVVTRRDEELTPRTIRSSCLHSILGLSLVPVEG